MLAPLLLLSVAMAQDVTRHLEQSYPLAPGGSLSLTTQAGRVEVRATDREDISLHLLIEGSSTEQVNQISVEERRLGSQLQLSTHWGEESFPPLALAKGLTLRYTLEVPHDLDLALRHGQGELVLSGEFTGTLDLRIRQGRLHAERLIGPDHRIDASLSQVEIEHLHRGRIDLNLGQLILGQAQQLTLETLGTAVEIDQVDQLDLSADLGSIDLGRVGRVRGHYGTAQVQIDTLAQSLDLEGKLAPALTIDHLGEQVAFLRLTGQASSLELRSLSVAALFLEVEDARFESTGLEADEPFESPAETGGGQNYRLTPPAVGRSAPGTLKIQLPPEGGRCEVRLK